MTRKRFKIGDKIRVLDHPHFTEKGKKLIGLEGKVISNRGDGGHDVMLYVDGQLDNVITAYLELSCLEAIS